MELTEAAQRILRHARLIVLVVLVCLTVPFILRAERDDAFSASTRVYFGPEVTNADEAKAMVDTAEAIVTSPSEIEAALEGTGIDRDPDAVVEEISVESIGASGVLSVSAVDADPDVAGALADAVAQQLVTSRRELLIGPIQERLADLDDELEAVTVDIGRITQQSEDAGAELDSLRFRLEEALRRQSDIRDEREALNETLNATPTAGFLGAATTPSQAGPNNLLADLVIAGLLGLILGVGLAALIEAIRPTIVSGDALARILGAPLLGRIPNPARGEVDLRDGVVASRLGMVISRARLDIVHLTGAGDEVDPRLTYVARRLEIAVPRVAIEVVGVDRETASPSPVTRTNRARHGLVVVAPEVLPRDALTGLEHLLTITQWPLVGIITYRTPLWTRFRVRDDVRSLWTRARSTPLPTFSPQALASSGSEAES